MAQIFDSPAQFSLHIETLSLDTDQSYIETILEFCDENFVDYEDVAKLITPVLKQKILEQARLQFSMPKETSYRLDDE